MSRTICCPTPTAIDSVVTSLNPCSADAGQIVKMVFWRAGNTIASEATAIISTTWTTLLAATGDTKAVVTPFVGGVTLPVSEPREYGGGNDTPFGTPIRKGGNSVPFSCNIFSADQDVIVALKQLACENLEVIFINESNQFVYSDGGSTTFGGFPVAVNSLFVSDKSLGGYNDPDMNGLMFNLKANWSDTLEVSAVTDFALDMINA